jgi:hypothetical protein
MRPRLPAVAALALSLLAASSAQAATYDVTGTGDAANPLPCTALVPGSAYQCTTLRRAVDEANANPDDDGILLHAGTYAITAGELSVTDSVIVIGESARTSVIASNGSSRVLSITGAATAGVNNVTVQGGSAVSSNGGNISVDLGAQLALFGSRVTGGTAFGGAGIVNSGTVSIQNSLVDHNVATNSGGGVLNVGSLDGPAQLTVVDSTIAANQASESGGGISSSGNTGNQVSLVYSTVAQNSSGLSFLGPQDANATATILGPNTGATCVGVSFSGAQFNVESSSACGLDPGTNRVNADPQFLGGLSNQGGPTDVLAIPASSPAVDFVTPCFMSIDQRNFQRFSTQGEPCDAGAYEQSGVDTNVQPPPPEPTPTPAPPQPTPAPTPAATPVPTGSVGVAEIAGTVLVRDPKTKRFVPFDESLLKTGAEVDTRKGTVEITNPAGEKAKFFDGIFKLAIAKGLTTLTLSEPLDCKRAKRGKARASAKKPKTRKLWGDGKGSFKTKGSYSAATVRGTKWLVKDTCTTTTTQVTQGTVLVDDLVKKKKVTLRAKKTYVARARTR